LGEKGYDVIPSTPSKAADFNYTASRYFNVAGADLGVKIGEGADASKVKEKLKWLPKHNDLEYIIKTAWQWEKERS